MKTYLMLAFILLILTSCNSTTKDNSGINITNSLELSNGTISKNNNTNQEIVHGGDKMRTKISIETNYGNMTAELYDDLVPKTAENFKKLAEKGFYNGTIFHRVIKDFMIQGGDPTGTGMGGPGYTIKDEFVSSLKHTKKGLFSMANSGPNTGGSQFFITLVATPWLDGKHAIFGELKSGLDILDKIGNTATDDNDGPLKEVKIQKIAVLK